VNFNHYFFNYPYLFACSSVQFLIFSVISEDVIVELEMASPIIIVITPGFLIKLPLGQIFPALWYTGIMSWPDFFAIAAPPF